MLAEQVPVVAGEHQHGVLEQAAFRQCLVDHTGALVTKSPLAARVSNASGQGGRLLLQIGFDDIRWHRQRRSGGIVFADGG